MSGGNVAAVEIVYQAILRAARSGQRCPTNPEICDLTGLASVSAGANIIAKLEKAGRVQVRRFQAGREVYIPQLDISTAEYAGKRSQHWREKNPARVQKSDEGRRTTQPRATASVVEVIPPVVNRDPCFWCGTRADIGCEHHASTPVIAA